MLILEIEVEELNVLVLDLEAEVDNAEARVLGFKADEDVVEESLEVFRTFQTLSRLPLPPQCSVRLPAQSKLQSDSSAIAVEILVPQRVLGCLSTVINAVSPETDSVPNTPKPFPAQKSAHKAVVIPVELVSKAPVRAVLPGAS